MVDLRDHVYALLVRPFSATTRVITSSPLLETDTREPPINISSHGISLRHGTFCCKLQN